MSTGRALLLSTIERLAPQYGFGDVSPALLVAQSELETGGWTSAIFRENRNAFGMKHPSVRPTTSIGSSRGHAVYRSVEDSVKDYFLRQQNFRIPNTPDVARYVASTVGTGYAEDPQYVGKWLRLYSNQPDGVAAPALAVLAPLLLLVALTYLGTDGARIR